MRLNTGKKFKGGEFMNVREILHIMASDMHDGLELGGKEGLNRWKLAQDQALKALKTLILAEKKKKDISQKYSDFNDGKVYGFNEGIKTIAKKFE